MEPFLPFVPALFLLSINKLPVLLLIGLNIVVSVGQVVTVPLAPSSVYDCGIFTAGRHVPCVAITPSATHICFFPCNILRLFSFFYCM